MLGCLLAVLVGGGKRVNLPATVWSLQSAVAKIADVAPEAVAVDTAGAHSAVLMCLDNMRPGDALAALTRVTGETVLLTSRGAYAALDPSVARRDSRWIATMAERLA